MDTTLTETKPQAVLLLLVLLAVAVVNGSPSDPWLTLYATVTQVKDGNNLTVRDRKGVVHLVRLSGIDAPDMRQPGGVGARSLVRELVLDREVRIVHRYFDAKGCILGKVYVGEVWLNRRLLEAGLAWFLDPDGDAPELEEVQAAARKEKLGIWSAAHPVPPWHWRRGSFFYKEGMENDLPRAFPRSRSSNDRVVIGVNNAPGSLPGRPNVSGTP